MREVPKSELLGDLEKQVRCVAKKIGLPDDVVTALMAPDTVLWFNLTVPYKGEMVTKTAIRVQHTLPSGGGCRVAEIKKIPEALAETGFLSFLMSLKLGVAGEAFGGGKAILISDPKNTPRDLLDLLFIRFGEKMAPFLIGRDRIAPDMYTDYRDMEKFLEGVGNILGNVENSQIRALATGKKVDGTSKGGMLGRDESTGWGVAYAAKLASKMMNFSLKNATVVIQGFGKVGIPAAERMIEWGSNIIAVSDSTGGIINRSGLDIEELKNFKKRTGTVVGFPMATFLTNDKLLEIKCDILMPCATEGRITIENALRINTKIISEGSNMGLTGKAKKLMSNNGIMILDGILANQAGVVTSILEAKQNKENKLYTFEDAVKNFDDKIRYSFTETLVRAEKYGMDMPDATLAWGIEQLIKRKFGVAMEELCKSDC